MTPERWQKLKELCHLALEREPSQRASFLADACRDDERLREEAESLLARATTEVLDDATWENPPAEVTETVIDHYRLLQKIGEGGMGEVWLAEQKEPVRRRVALKLVKAGMNTREVIGRFESERQALALMEHPAIAKVYDAGSTSQGAPYFVMEYVAGVPITEYCDNHRLPIKERLELFMQVCEGVRHAHQKAVIHRDLKPSNILVTEVDGRAAPKIIDFGVAKALSQKLTPYTMFTRVGSLIGTPEYMSPEQARSSGEDVDTRTDVYSLGIIFYELLAGAPPIELRKVEFDEFLRKLREEDPPKPSTKIRTGDAATTTELARRRQTEPMALARQIGGDLDSIALKALEKDRSRRYGSAADFAADIGRYLRSEAVQAVPPSAVYRARKFASRHRWGVVMACAFVAVLTAAAAISIRQSIRANREAAVAEAVSNFLRNDVLAQASAYAQSGPTTKPDPHLEVRTALDRAAANIGGKFDRQPEVEAAIRATIGQTYLELGLYPEARTQLERALELERRALGAKDAKTLRIASRLGVVAINEGRNADAEAIFNQTLQSQRRALGAEHADTLYSMDGLDNVYIQQGKYAQAETLQRQILEIRRRRFGPEDSNTLVSMEHLANALSRQGKYPEAEKLYDQVLEVRRRVAGSESPGTLLSMDNLANVYYVQGKFEQSEELLNQVIAIQRRVLGEKHPDTLSSLAELGDTYLRDGKYAQGKVVCEQALEIERRALGPEHPLTLDSMSGLAIAYFALGKPAQAEALDGEILEIRRRKLGPDHPDTLMDMDRLADVYSAEAKYGPAEALFSKALATSRGALGAGNPVTIVIAQDFAYMYQRQGNYAQAATYFREVFEGRRDTLGTDNSNTAEAAANLALAYVSEGKFLDSEPLARQAVEFYEKNHEEGWPRFYVEALLGASLAGQKKYVQAEPLLLEGYKGMLERKSGIGGPQLYYFDSAHKWLVQMYAAWGKPEKAAEWRKK